MTMGKFFHFSSCFILMIALQTLLNFSTLLYYLIQKNKEEEKKKRKKSALRKIIINNSGRNLHYFTSSCLESYKKLLFFSF